MSTELYDATFLRHLRAPSGARPLRDPSASARAANPLCGDEVELTVRSGGGRIEEVAHRTRGCAIVTVSASLLTQAVTGATEQAALRLAHDLEMSLATGAALPEQLEPLRVVHLLPSRRRCARLPWEALRLALEAPRGPSDPAP